MTVDLYVWKAPRDLGAEAAAELIERWRDAGADPAASPFEPSTDVGWFHRELRGDAPGLDILSDAVPSGSRNPIWLSAGDEEKPARMVRIRFGDDVPHAALEDVFGLATKYDLVVFDPYNRRITRPLEVFAAEASATFWPWGAVRAAVVGGFGGLIGVGAWLLGIPILSGLVALVGGFMFVMAVWSIVHEARARAGARPDPEGGSPGA